MAFSPHFDPRIYDHPSWPLWMPDHRGVIWKYSDGDAAFISPPPSEAQSPKTVPSVLLGEGKRAVETQPQPLAPRRTVAAHHGGALLGVPAGTRGSLQGGHGARGRSRPPAPIKMALGTWGAGLIISRRRYRAPRAPARPIPPGGKKGAKRWQRGGGRPGSPPFPTGKSG